jgi:NIMA (never in mitosis gene a)-related kinase
VLKEIDLTKLDEDVKRAALGEAQLLSSLNHPCIVGYIESFLTDAPPLDESDSEEGAAAAAAPAPKRKPLPGQARDTLCIVMEYCAGGDVGEVIRRMKSSEMRNQSAAAQPAQPPFTEDQILDWFVQLALALKYIHSHHILHRDLKAQNVSELMRDSARDHQAQREQPL